MSEMRPFRGRYLVSDDGFIVSLCRGKPKRLSAAINTSGYEFVEIRDGAGGRELHRVHRIVCEVFNGPAPFEGAICRHLDGNRRNNRPDNLAWGTVSENAFDSVRHGTHPGRANGLKGAAKISGQSGPGARLTWTQVDEIRSALARGALGIDLADKFGVSPSAISLIARRKTWATKPHADAWRRVA